MKALFIEVSRRRALRLLAKIEEATGLGIGLLPDSGGESLGRADVVFLDGESEWRRLEAMVDRMRDRFPERPIVLLYEAEPQGRLFALAARYGCRLYSETDRLGRTMTAEELADSLTGDGPGQVERRLMEITLSTGPCSTGDQ
jgi:hypothetical protein